MLVLTRRIGEQLVFGDDIRVNVLGINGNQVRIGINAPKDVPVHREEIYALIQKEKEAALAKAATQLSVAPEITVYVKKSRVVPAELGAIH